MMTQEKVTPSFQEKLNEMISIVGKNIEDFKKPESENEMDQLIDSIEHVIRCKIHLEDEPENRRLFVQMALEFTSKSDNAVDDDDIYKMLQIFDFMNR